VQEGVVFSRLRRREGLLQGDGTFPGMNPRSLLPELRVWFADYVRRFDSEDPMVREKKYLETIRDTLPRESACINKVYDRACAYLYRNAQS